jgi:hypothetical protein
MTTWTREMPWETWVVTKKKRYVVVRCEASKEGGARRGRRMRYGNISQGRRNESARRAQRAMVLIVIFNGCRYDAMQYVRMGQDLDT